MEKYYDLIVSLIKNHRKYSEYENILDDIVRDVYEHAKTVLDSVSDETVISSYLNKIVSTSMISVPKKLGLSQTRAHKLDIQDIIKPSETEQNLIIEESNAVFDEEVSDDVFNEILADDSEEIIKTETIENFTNNDYTEEIQNDNNIDSTGISVDKELVDKMINGVSFENNEETELINTTDEFESNSENTYENELSETISENYLPIEMDNDTLNVNNSEELNTNDNEELYTLEPVSQEQLTEEDMTTEGFETENLNLVQDSEYLNILYPNKNAKADESDEDNDEDDSVELTNELDGDNNLDDSVELTDELDGDNNLDGSVELTDELDGDNNLDGSVELTDELDDDNNKIFEQDSAENIYFVPPSYSKFSLDYNYSEDIEYVHELQNNIENLNAKQPDKNILLIYNLKYKENKSVDEIASEIGTDVYNVLDALNEIIYLVKD